MHMFSRIWYLNENDVHYFYTFVCVEGTVTIDGEVFPIGTYTFSNGNGTLTSIAYDASSSTDCKIIFVA